MKTENFEMSKRLKPSEKSLANLRPPWKKGEAPPGAGRPAGVKSWRTVFKDLFEMSQEEILASTGIKIKKAEGKKQLQYLVAMRAIKMAACGDNRALETIMDRMDGKAAATIDANITGALGFQINVVDYSGSGKIKKNDND